MSKVNIALINMGETLITSLIQELGPHKFAIALSNANSHGKAFVDAGYEGALKRDDDVILNAWHKAVDDMIKLGKQLEGMV